MSLVSRKKAPRPRLIDDSDFAISRDRSRSLFAKDVPQFRSEDHTKWLGTLACHVCGISPAAARLADIPIAGAHVRKGTDGGGSVKPSDYFCWPGCGKCHLGIQHIIGEPAFFARFHILDPIRMTLVDYGMKSICPKTRVAANDEFQRRYAA